MRKSIIFILLCCVLSVWANETITLALGEWPPYLTDHEKDNGIVARIIREIFEEAGYTVEFEFLPWARAYEEAKTGRVDGTAVWLKTTEREKEFYYSSPLVKETHVFFHLKETPFTWDSLSDLHHVKVGGIIGFSYGQEFDSVCQEGLIPMHRVSTDKQAFNMLLSGRISVYPQEIQVGYHSILTELPPNQAKQIWHHPKIFLQKESFLLLSKNVKRNEHLLKIFNRGLKKLKESGTYDLYFQDLEKYQK